MTYIYKAGEFLYKRGDKGIKKEAHKVFIYTGKNLPMVMVYL